MRQSYTVTVPEEPPAAAFPFLKQEMRRKGSMSGSVLVSTFVGLLINQAKVMSLLAPNSIEKSGNLMFIRCYCLVIGTAVKLTRHFRCLVNCVVLLYEMRHT